jgi:hypothetical protein
MSGMGGRCGESIDGPFLETVPNRTIPTVLRIALVLGFQSTKNSKLRPSACQVNIKVVKTEV